MNFAKLKYAVYRAARRFKILNLARRFGRSGVVIFYHGIEPKITDSRVQDIHYSLEQFEKQVRYLSENFQVISMQEFCALIDSNQKIDPKLALITIDDGYRNNLLHASPLLHSLRLPFTVFVSTRHIDEGIRFPTYYTKTAFLFCGKKSVWLKRTKLQYDLSTDTKLDAAIYDISERVKYSTFEITMDIVKDLKDLLSIAQWEDLNERFSSDQPLNWEEIRQIQFLGGTIGSHNHDHVLLHEDQSNEEMERQLLLSRQLLIKNTGQGDFYCYPNGNERGISPRSVSFVEKAGYRLGFSSLEGQIGPRSNRYLLPRIGAANFECFTALVNLSWRFNRRFDVWDRQLSTSKMIRA